MSASRLPDGMLRLLPSVPPGLVFPPRGGPDGEVAPLDIDALFPAGGIVDMAAARACLAGVLLFRDQFDQSHGVSQALDTPEGSYWHGILHRREPDPTNAKYWMRRVGWHPIHARLAHDILRAAESRDAPSPLRGNPADAIVDGCWDAARFIDRCRFRDGKALVEGDAERIAVAWQSHEMTLLLDFCRRSATGGSAD